MKVLFVSWAWSSHFYPLVPLAWALTSAGHEVRVATAPDRVDTVTRTGLIGVATGSVVAFHKRIEGAMDLGTDASAADRVVMEQPKVVDTLDAFAEVATAMLDDLVELAREWQPDLVVFDQMSFAGPIVAKLRGIPSVRYLWGPDMPGYLRQLMGPSVGGPVVELFERYGFPDAQDVWGTLTLDPSPPSLQVPTPYPTRQMRFVPFNGAAPVPGWLGAPRHRPLVCVTGGTTNPVLGRHMFLVPEQATAIADLDVDVVVAVSAADSRLLGDLPANVRVVESLPLHLLLQDSDLLVSHGGAGTFMTGVHRGLPQLIIPSMPDHMFYGNLLSTAGAGVVLGSEEADAETIRKHVGELLAPDSGYAAAAARLRAENEASPAPSAIVGVLEELVASH